MERSRVDFLVRPSDSVRESEDYNGMILFDVQQGLCFGLNAVGWRIWRMMKMNQPLAQIIENLVADFNVPKERVSCDVMTFVELLNEEGLLSHEVNHDTNSPVPSGA
jgi:hypothetical protein